MPPSPGSHDAFISYSRRDADFVQHLHAALRARGREVWIDWEDIPPTAQWWSEIQAAIDNANAFLFVISEHSLASPVCARELDHAVAARKRLIPLVRGPSPTRPIPDHLKPVNWLFFPSDPGAADHDAPLPVKPGAPPVSFNACIEQLLAALDTDLDHVRSHTRLLVRSREWESQDRNASYALHGQDLRDAEAWLASSADKRPNPSQLHRDYVLASRLRATRRQRTLLGSVVTALVITTILAAVALALSWFADARRREAETQTRVAQTQTEQALAQKAEAEKQAAIALSRQLAAQSEALQEQTSGSIPTAALLAAEGLRRYPTPEADAALRQALDQLPEPVVHIAQTRPARGLALSPSGRLLAVHARPGLIELFDTTDGKRIGETTVCPAELLPLAISPDERYLACVEDPRSDLSQDRRPEDADRVVPTTVKVSDIRGGCERVAAVVGDSTPDGIRFSSDSRHLTIVFSDGFVVRAAAADGAVVQSIRLAHDVSPLTCAISGDGRIVVAAGSGRSDPAAGQAEDARFDGPPIVTISDLESGRSLVSFSEDRGGYFSFTGVSADGSVVLVGSSSGIGVFRLPDTRPLLRLKGKEAQEIGQGMRLALRPDGTQFAGATREDLVKVFDTVSGDEVVAIPEIETAAGLWFAPAGPVLMSLGPGGATVRSSETGETLFRFHPDPESCEPVFSENGAVLASALRGSFGVFKVAPAHGALTASRTRARGRSILDHQFNLAHNRTGTRLAVAGRTLKVLDVPTGRLIREWRPATFDDAFIAVAYDPTRDLLATVSFEGTVALWSIGAERPQVLAHRSDLTPHPTGVAFRPDGALLAAGNMVFDVATGRKLRTQDLSLRSGYSGTCEVAWSPDGSLISFAPGSGRTVVVEADSGRLLRYLGPDDQQPINVSFTTGGDRLIVNRLTDGIQQQIVSYDTATWQEQHLLSFEQMQLSSLTLGPGGLMAGVAYHDSSTFYIRIYDLASGLERSAFRYTGPLNNPSFSPDGKRLAFYTDRCRFLIVPQDELLAEAARLVGHNLSRAEWSRFLPGEPYRETFPGLLIPVTDKSDVRRRAVSESSRG